jgi:hypothetical protein
MVFRPFAFSALALYAAAGIASPAGSQSVAAPCRLCEAGSETEPAGPGVAVQLDIETSLDFDRIILSGPGEGSASIDPSGGHSVSGSISNMGDRAMVGRVVVRGEPGRLVRIQLPDSVILSGLAGGSIRLDSIRSDLPSAPRLDSRGTLSFRFGGILRVQGDLDGEFRGDVPIDVDYF